MEIGTLRVSSGDPNLSYLCQAQESPKCNSNRYVFFPKAVLASRASTSRKTHIEWEKIVRRSEHESKSNSVTRILAADELSEKAIIPPCTTRRFQSHKCKKHTENKLAF